MNTFLIEDLQWLLFSNVTKLEGKKKRTHTIQKWIKSKAKHQLETTLIIRNIKGRKNINVTGKDLLS